MINHPVILCARRDCRFSELLRAVGFEVLNLEMIETEPATDLTDLRRKLEHLHEYDGLFFTSPAAVDVFATETSAAKKKFGGKIYALGVRARRALEEAGFAVEFQPAANTAEELIGAYDIGEFAGKKLLFVRGDRSMRTIPQLIGGPAGIDEVVVYETRDVKLDEPSSTCVLERLSRGEIGWICFFSPSAVESFRKQIGTGRIGSINAAAIGETTARAARENGMRVEFVSRRATSEDFANGFIEHLRTIE